MDFSSMMQIVTSGNNAEVQDKAVLKAFSAVGTCFPCDMAVALGQLDDMHVSPAIEKYRQTLLQKFKENMKSGDKELREKIIQDPNPTKAKRLYGSFKLAISWKQVAGAFKALSSPYEDLADSDHDGQIDAWIRRRMMQQMQQTQRRNVKDDAIDPIPECDVFLLIDIMEHFSAALREAIDDANHEQFWHNHCKRIQQLGAVQRLAGVTSSFSVYISSVYRHFGATALEHTKEFLTNMGQMNEMYNETMAIEGSEGTPTPTTTTTTTTTPLPPPVPIP